MYGISVVIPCYNAAPYLRETLESVVNQQFDGALEVLVADDDSTDGSREIAESFGAPVRVLPHPYGDKRNAAAARNRCIRAATMPLIAFLDADDLFLPGHLHALSKEMNRDPELGLIYDKGFDFDSDSGDILRPRLSEPHDPCTTPDKLLLGQSFGTGQVMVRHDVFQQVGYFDETLAHAEDHDMWLRILEAYPAAFVPFDGFMYRFHSNQKSSRNTLWPVTATVFENACKRYPYSAQSIRKRKAILAYRFSEVAREQGELIRANFMLGKAVLLDPARAAKEFSNRTMTRLAGIWRRPKSHIDRTSHSSNGADFT